ncbi:MAG: hypothetical protein NC200_01940, partial [Candidatus Gastranaerophilales bacterium]|nr:hypothetical protein [Candidatus Gastranaerophilales bacterium]
MNIKRIFTRYILALLCIIGIGTNTVADAAYELSTNPTDGSVQVTVNGSSYYFTPDASDTAYQNTTSLKNTLVTSGATDADFYIVNGTNRTYYKMSNDLDTFIRTASSGDAFSLANNQTYILTSNLSQFDKDGQYSIYANLGEEGRIYAGGRQLFYVNNANTNLNVANMVLTGASTNSFGSIFYNSAGTVNLSNSKVNQNAAGNGGAIYNAVGSTFNIHSTTFDTNRANDPLAGGGGAVYNAGQMLIEDSVFTNNTARNGGAIYNTGTLEISGTTFTGNTATSGSAIYNTGTINLSSSTFGENDSIYNNSGAEINISGLSPTTIRSSILGAGTLNVAGALNLYGDISNTQTVNILQDGVFSIYNTSSSFVFNPDAYSWLGTINLAAAGTTLAFNSGSYNIIGTLIGESGSKILNTGTDLTIKGNANTSSFNGSYEQNGGSLTVDLGSRLFSGEKNIKSGKLTVNSDNLVGVNNIKLGSDTTMLINTTTGGEIADGIFGFTGSNAIAEFGSTGQTTNKPSYRLSSISGNYADMNTVKLSGVNVALSDSSYMNNKYVFDNSVINLVDNTSNSYTFENLTSSNSDLSIDIDLATATSDKLIVNSGSGTINLKNVSVRGVTGDNSVDFVILDGNSSVILAIDAAILDQRFNTDMDSVIYTDTSVGSKKFVEYKNNMDKTIGLTLTIGDKMDALAAINQASSATDTKFANRSFLFRSDNETYTITSDLGATGSGVLTINQNASGTHKNVVISGGDATRYSMFLLTNNSATIRAYDVTFQNAAINNEGNEASVFDIGAGTLVLQGVKFADNAGYAVFNGSGSVTLTDVIFSRAIGGNSNAVFNANQMTFEGKSTVATNINNIQGAIIEFNGASNVGSELTAEGSITNDGTIFFNNGMAINGSIENKKNGLIRFNSPSRITGTVTNAGTMNLSKVTLDDNSLTNTGNVTFGSQGDTNTISNGAFFYNGDVTGSGTVSVQGTLIMDSSVIENNSGTFDLSGTLNATGSDSYIRIASGSAFSILSSGKIIDDNNRLRWEINSGGTLNIACGGTSALTLGANDIWDGTINLRNSSTFTLDSTYGNGSGLTMLENYLTSEDTVSTFINSGNTIEIIEDNSIFTGVYEQIGGTLKSSSANLFGGIKRINNNGISTNPAQIIITDGGSFGFADVYLGNYATLTSTSMGGSLTSGVFFFSGQNSTAIFQSANSATPANFSLYPITWNNSQNSTNTIWFKDATLSLLKTDADVNYSYSGPRYALQNTTIDVQDNAFNTYEFSYLYASTASDSVIPIRIDLDVGNATSDKFVVRNGAGVINPDNNVATNGGVLKIADIIFSNVVSTNTEKSVTILQVPYINGQDENNLFKLEVDDTAISRNTTMKHDVMWNDILSDGFKSRIESERIGSYTYWKFIYSFENYKDLLAALNTYDFGDNDPKTFSFDDQYSQELYTVAMDLGKTFTGQLSIIGNNKTKNIIDANNHSMFEFVDSYAYDGVNPTVIGRINLDISKLTIQNASSTSEGGSVVSMNNTATGTALSMNDVIVKSSKVSGPTIAQGGAIFINSGTATITNSDFQTNYANSAAGLALGGAIYLGTSGQLNIENTSFKDNYATSSSKLALGGAIYLGTSGQLNIENTSFKDNYATSSSKLALGGAIFTRKDLTITAKDGYTSVFSGNYISGMNTTNVQVANAIFVACTSNSTLSNPTLTLSVPNNGAIQFDHNSIEGGYLQSDSVVRQNADYQFNLVLEGIGGTIALSDIVGANLTTSSENISISFTDATINYSNVNITSGGCALTIDQSTIKNAKSTSSAINLNSTSAMLTAARFENNAGGALRVSSGSALTFSGLNIFTGNSIVASSSAVGAGMTVAGSAISTDVSPMNATFTNNYVSSVSGYAAGGAMYLSDISSDLVSISASFTDNYAKTTSSNMKALGGAIYTNSNIAIVADGTSSATSNISFTGNYTSDTASGKIYNAIFMANGASLTLRSINSGKITFNDTIDGGNVDNSFSNVSYGTKYNLNVTGDGTGSTVNLFNTVKNAAIVAENVTLELNGSNTNNKNLSANNADLLMSDDTNAYSTLTVNSGALRLSNLTVNNASKILNINEAANVTILNSKINMADSTAGQILNLGTINTDSNSIYSFDFDFSGFGATYDSFVVGTMSTGTMVLDVNWRVDNPDNVLTGVYEIISNSNIRLRLKDDKEWSYTVPEDGIVYYDTYLGKKTAQINQNAIEIVDTKLDTLAQISTFDTGVEGNVRRFEFTKNEPVEEYVLYSNLYNPATGKYPSSGTLYIVGLADRDNSINGLYTAADGSEVNYAMYQLRGNDNITIDISNLTIKNVGMYSDTNSSVAYLDNSTARLNLTNVNLTDNTAYAIYNKIGLVNFTNVTVNAPTIEQIGSTIFNEIYNAANTTNADGDVTGGLVTSGTNKFYTKVTNAGLVKTTGSNTFFADIANTGTIRMSGENTVEGNADKEISIYNGRTGSSTSGILEVLDNSTLNVRNYATLASDQTITLEGTSTVNVIGGILNIDSRDTWYGKIVLSDENSVLNYTGVANNEYTDQDSFTRGILEAANGSINLSGQSTLYVTGSDQVSDNVLLNIGGRSTLYIANHATEASSLTLSVNEDIWEGNIILENSYLTLSSESFTHVADGNDDNAFIFTTAGMLSTAEDDTTSTFRNSGVDITVRNNQSGFNGTYIQDNDGSIEITTAGTFFSADSKKQINSGTVKATRQGKIDFSNVSLGSDTTMTLSSTGGDINSDLLTFTGSDAQAILYFYSGANPEDYYTLYNISNSRTNTITIGNKEANSKETIVRLGFNEDTDSYDFTGSTKYAFVNTTIDMLNDKDYNDGFNTYRFSNIDIGANTTFKIDLDLASIDVNKISDKIDIGSEPANAGQTQKINLDLNYVQTPSATSGNTSQIIQILSGVAAGFYELNIKNDDTAWTYEDYKTTGSADWNTFVGTKSINLYSSMTTNDSIILVCEQDDTLRAINTFRGSPNREFRFTGENQTYTLLDNTGDTAQGVMNVIGVDRETNIIDATNTKYNIINEDTHLVEDIVTKSFTMFQLTNDATTLNISDVTIKNAVLGDGALGTSDLASAIYIQNGSAVVNLTNVAFENNEGDAIYNAGNLNMSGVVFARATTVDFANSIYNTGTIRISGVGNRFNTNIQNTGSLTIENDALVQLSAATISNATPNATLTINGNLALDATGELLSNAGNVVVTGSITGPNASSYGRVNVQKGSIFTLSGQNSSVAEGIAMEVRGSLVVKNNYVVNPDASICYGLILSDNDVFLNNGADETGTISIQQNGVVSLRSGLNGVATYTLSNSEISGDATARLYNGIAGADRGLELIIDSNESVYNGIYTQYGSLTSLIVTENGTIFSGDKYIEEGSRLEVTSNTINYSGVYLGVGANYKHFSSTDNGGTINNALLTYTAAGATATFTTVDGLAPVKYTLNPITPSSYQNNAVNNLIVNNAILTLSGSDFSANATGGYVAYRFENSQIDVSTPPTGVVSLTDYIFTNLTLVDSAFKLDIDLSTLQSDTITISQGGSATGVVKVIDINFLNVSEYAEGIVQIIKNGNSNFYLNIDEILADATGKYVWEYEIDPTTKTVY